MSHNRKVLKTATKELGKAKAPAKPKDIITDPMGQWKYPGQNTRIPGSDITMQGVDYPVWAQPNIGQPQMMYPNQEYQFPGADYVDEFPQGGNEDYYEDELTDDEIAELRAGGYVVEDISVPSLTKAQNGIIITDPKEYAYRKQMYDDSLNLYNLTNNQLKLNPPVHGQKILMTKKEKEQYNSKLFDGYLSSNIKLNKNITKTNFKRGDENLDNNFIHPTIKPYKKYPGSVTYAMHYLYKKPTQPVSFQSKPEVGKLETKKLPQIETPEIIPNNYNYTPQKPETIKTASRSQTVMEPDPNRPGKYIMKEIRQVPYSAKFPGEAKWELTNAPRVIYIDAEGNETEERPGLSKQKQGGALLTKKITCKKCGWTWDAADGGDDITTCHKCGGEGLVHAKKGGSLKKYSRSLEATNKLFYKSPLFKKAKSKKKKIFDPNSQYFKVGGIPELPLREGRAAYERLGYTDNDRMAMAIEGGFLPQAQDGYVNFTPYSNRGDMPGVETFGTKNPTMNIGYTRELPGNLFKNQGFEKAIGNITTKLPYNNNTGVGIQGGLKLIGNKWVPIQNISKANMETDVTAGYDPKLGFHSSLITSPQFTFGNVQPTISKIYGTGLKSGEWLAKVGPYAGASYTPGREIKEEKFAMPAGVKAGVDFGLGRRGIKAGLSGYYGADVFGQSGSKTTNATDAGQLQGRTHYGFEAGLKVPLNLPVNWAKNLVAEKQKEDLNYYTPKLKQGGFNSNYIEVDADDNDIANYIAQGYKVEELSKAQYAGQTPFIHPNAGATNILFQKSTPVKPNSTYNPKAPVNYQAQLKPVVADNTKDVTANQAVVAKQINDYMATDEYKAKQKAKKEAQAQFEKEQWDKYNKMSFGEKVLDRTNAALNQPLLMAANALVGDQAYIPGMAEGLGEEGPDYDKWLKATGQERGLGINDVFNAFNPGNWGGHAGREYGKGNYVQGATELGLGLLGLKGAPLMGNQLAKSSANKLINLEKKLGTKTSSSNNINQSVIPTQNLKSKLTALDSFLGQVVGKTLKGKGNKKAIQEGNDWLTNWINDPITQKKIDLDWESFNTRSNFVKDVYDIGYEQAKTFEPLSKEYPLSNQFKELIERKGNIHAGNRGVSYIHGYDPFFRSGLGPSNFISNRVKEDPRRAGSWISRDPFMSQAQRASTTVHEGVHDWKSDFLLKRSGQHEDISNLISPDFYDAYIKSQVDASDLSKHDQYKAYLADPTEIDARIMQLRKQFNLTPEGSVKMTSEEAQKIMNTVKNLPKKEQLVTPQFFDVIDNDPEKLASLFRRLWGVAPVAGAASLLNSGEENTSDFNTLDLEGRSFKNGGSLELELTPEEIQAYIDAGYTIEDID